MKTINIDGIEYALVPVDAELEAILHPFKKLPEVEIDVIRTRSMLIESDKYVFEAIKLDDYEGCDVKFINKQIKPWEEEDWDNINWLRGVLENNPESLEMLREEVCPQGEAEFKAFLKVLKEEGWI